MTTLCYIWVGESSWKEDNDGSEKVSGYAFRIQEGEYKRENQERIRIRV